MIGLEKDILNDMAIQLSKLIKHNVNIFNVDGLIVGSSDLSRIGEYHEFAHNIIKGKVKEYKVYKPKSDNVRPGINLPIHSEGKIIGAVGVTGNPDEINVFSEIIKLSLESLISQQLAKEKNQEIRKYEKQVVLDILFDLSQKDNITKRLDILEFNKKNNYLVIKFNDNTYDFKSLFNNVDSIKASMNDKLVYIATSDEETTLNEIIKIIINDKYEAIYSRVVSFDKISREYKVINYIEQFHLSKDKLTYSCDDYSLDCYFYSLKNSEFDLSRHFNEGISIYNNKDLVETFEKYVENNLSLVKTAKSLFIHLNTLKYRIKRIEELTNCNLKNIDDIMKLKLSLLYIKDK